MHRKYAKDGLAVVSVTLDDPADKGQAAKALKFLQDRGAEFPNYLLDEDPGVWQEKLNVNGPPCLYFFDRDNHWVKKLGEDDKPDPEAQERLVEELLGIKK